MPTLAGDPQQIGGRDRLADTWVVSSLAQTGCPFMFKPFTNTLKKGRPPYATPRGGQPPTRPLHSRLRQGGTPERSDPEDLMTIPMVDETIEHGGHRKTENIPDGAARGSFALSISEDA